MCAGPELLAIGTALTAGSTLAAGYQQKKMGDYANDQAAADAKAAQGAAQVEADRIREQGKRQQALARAALAGSGVNVNQGTALNINEDINQRTEQDALMTILQGNYGAQNIVRQGQIAKREGRDAFGASLLSAGGTAAMGAWRYQNPGKGQ